MLELRIPPATFDVSEKGAVTGAVYFEVDGEAFPDEGWSDFVVVVLSWWCEALAELGRGASPTLRFMDGPYAVEVEPDGGSVVVSLRFLRDGDEARGPATLPAAELRWQVLGAARQLLEYCEREGVGGRDVESLRRGVAALSAAPGAAR